jgi:hypothetical protein
MGGGDPQRFVTRFFGEENFQNNKYKLGNLKLSHFLDGNGRCIDNNTVTVLLGFQLPNEKYDNIRMCFNEISTGITRPIAPGSCVELKTFCKRFSRGSKPFRKLLSGTVPDEISRNIVTYAENTQTIIGLDMGRLILTGFGVLHSFRTI